MTNGGSGDLGGKGQKKFDVGGGIRQCNVTCRKNVALQCGCNVPMAE